MRETAEFGAYARRIREVFTALGVIRAEPGAGSLRPAVGAAP